MPVSYFTPAENELRGALIDGEFPSELPEGIKITRVRRVVEDVLGTLSDASELIRQRHPLGKIIEWADEKRIFEAPSSEKAA